MINKGDVFYADLNPVIGSEQGGVRPVVILQNDIGNRYSPTTIVAPMTTKSKTYVPMHVKLKESFLAGRSTLLLEQIRTIDKRRLLSKMGSISQESQNQIDKVLDKNFLYIRKGIIMIGFVIGLFVGGFLGVCVMCLCNVASRADNNIEQMSINKESEDNNETND